MSAPFRRCLATMALVNVVNMVSWSIRLYGDGAPLVSFCIRSLYEHVFIHLPATRQPCPHMLSFQLRLCLVLIIAQKSPWHQPSRSFSTTRRTSGIRSSSRLHLNASRNSKMVSTRVLDQAQLLCVSLVLFCAGSHYYCSLAPNLRMCANFAALPCTPLVGTRQIWNGR